jgi:formylglycine-generating enzyme required for sulfatase activity
MRRPDIDDLDCQALEKEEANKSFLNREKLRNLLENEKEKPQIRLSASWLLKQWGEEVPIWTAEVDKQGKIALSIIAENDLPATVIEELEDGINLEIVEVPGGEFWMGSPEGEEGAYPNERPQHKVKVSPFLISRYPITQSYWWVVASSFPKVELDLNPDPSQFKGDLRRPVESITWYEAVEFCQRLSRWSLEKGQGYQYRLPSEAEWEHACRSVISEESIQNLKSKIQNPAYPPYHFGQKIDPALANYAETARGRTTPVGRFQAANSYGLYDMHGNVWEWCADHWHDSYEGAPDDGSAWLSENENNYRLLRGGSWSYNPQHCRSATRHRNYPVSRTYNIGLRVVASSRTVYSVNS